MFTTICQSDGGSVVFLEACHHSKGRERKLEQTHLNSHLKCRESVLYLCQEPEPPLPGLNTNQEIPVWPDPPDGPTRVLCLVLHLLLLFPFSPPTPPVSLLPPASAPAASPQLYLLLLLFALFVLMSTFTSLSLPPRPTQSILGLIPQCRLYSCYLITLLFTLPGAWSPEPSSSRTNTLPVRRHPLKCASPPHVHNTLLLSPSAASLLHLLQIKVPFNSGHGGHPSRWLWRLNHGARAVNLGCGSFLLLLLPLPLPPPPPSPLAQHIPRILSTTKGFLCQHSQRDAVNIGERAVSVYCCENFVRRRKYQYCINLHGLEHNKGSRFTRNNWSSTKTETVFSVSKTLLDPPEKSHQSDVEVVVNHFTSQIYIDKLFYDVNEWSCERPEHGRQNWKTKVKASVFCIWMVTFEILKFSQYTKGKLSGLLYMNIYSIWGTVLDQCFPRWKAFCKPHFHFLAKGHLYEVTATPFLKICDPSIYYVKLASPLSYSNLDLFSVLSRVCGLWAQRNRGTFDIMPQRGGRTWAWTVLVS